MSELIIDDANYIIRKGINNSTEFINIFEEFKKSRNFAILSKMNPDMFNELIKIYNQYILSNGLFIKKLFKFPFDEFQSFCFNILTRNPQKYQNNWFTYISNYIFSKFNEDISMIELEELKYIDCYYSENLSRKIKKLVTSPPQISIHESDIKDMDKLIKIGECCRYDCVGFYNNELLYLLCGLCINEGIKREFKTFNQLFKFVKSYLQLWQFNKVYELKTNGEYNLVTHIKHNGNYVKRYKRCKDYFENYDFKSKHCKTKYIEDKNKNSIYIETKLTQQEINDIWASLETLFSETEAQNAVFDLYYNYVTSQLLTRSSCLSALIILQIMYYKQNKKFIKINPNEQLDWYSISVDSTKFKETFWDYCKEIELDTSDVKCSKVSEVLNYTHYYIASNLNK